MNCKNVKPLLSEFVDERLDASTAWQVQTHVSECADCGPDSTAICTQSAPAGSPRLH